MEALHSLKSTEPQQWLTPSVTLSQAARMASQHLFSCLKPHTPKSPFEKLLVEGFDAEQIWQQIDTASQPLISSLRRKVMKLEKNPEGIKLVAERKSERKQLDDDDEDDVDDDVEEEGESEEDDDDVDDEVDEEGGSEEEEEKGGIEDKFLKIKELEAYLEDDEAREYGDLNNSKNDDVNKKKRKRSNELDDDEEEDDDDEDEEEKEDVDDEDEEDNYVDDDDADELGNAKYEDFFGAKKKTTSKGKLNVVRKDSSSDDEEMDEKQGGPSTHEKQLEKLRSEIEQMEKANLEPKTWTMRGEVTATSRPKNSALEVDLDFEHNVRPAPVITEEVTASLEDMIQSRIIEGRFDDVQKLPSLPSTTQREVKEMDENKSKKGLAEVYEEEYIQKTNLAAAPISFSDEQKKEAAILFKKLCLKLDALSHFHFAPKPVIEEMSIQANVPALAMEEIAPLAVSDASMLAPEEVFSGKGDIKEDAELAQAERKRRRAKKKRKFKAEGMKRMAKRARQNTSLLDQNDGKGG